MTLFDVVLPTHRRPQTVPFAITSVLEQTVSDLTLHVVGDGCDDRTEEAVRAFADPRVRFSRFPKAPGLGYANRNAVLRTGTAPFVAYMTDDDLLFPDHLERALSVLETAGCGLVAFRFASVRRSGALDPNFFAFDWRLGRLSRFLRDGFVGSANLVHRRSLFDRIGYWDETLPRFGDREFHRRARRAGEAAFADETTLLRFFAADWDRRYSGLAAPPQEAFAARLRDAAWRNDVRRRAAAGARGVRARAAQIGDLAAFAARSGPRFVRFRSRGLRGPRL